MTATRRRVTSTIRGTEGGRWYAISTTRREPPPTTRRGLSVFGDSRILCLPLQLAPIGAGQATDLVERSNGVPAQGVPVKSAALDDVERITGAKLQDELLIILHALPPPSFQTS